MNNLVLINCFIPEWSRRLKNDHQYLIASIGYLYGFSRMENDWPNHEELLEVWNSDHILKNLKSNNESEIQDSDELIKTSIRSPRGEMLERNAHDNILRSDKKTVNSGKTSSNISSLLKKVENWAVRNQ